MDEKALLLKIWDREAPATRKVLGRIPEGSDYRPDPKSRTAREIAWLIVGEEIMLAEGLARGAIEFVDRPAPSTMKEIVELYDRRHDDITAAMHRLEPRRWEARVPFMVDGQEVMADTGYEMAWGFLLDIIHHRGQITTYLRAMGSTVPQIYGPSADEPM
jgi:uncharacterized damage-inducible protein DinB